MKRACVFASEIDHEMLQEPPQRMVLCVFGSGRSRFLLNVARKRATIFLRASGIVDTCHFQVAQLSFRNKRRVCASEN